VSAPPGVLILAGPTASGKTELALAVAERFGAEIVGADSRQIYRGMSIGTAAPSAEQRARVPHHLVEFLDPQERYSAARFATEAMAAIATIAERGRRALVVGGTGFYLRALCGDVALAGAHDENVRRRLAREARLHPPEALHGWLAALNPARAATIDPADPYRVARALEIALLARTAQGRGEPERVPTLRSRGLAYRKLYLTQPIAVLERRIATRVDRMLAAGLLEEAERIGAGAVAADAVGYREALAYLQGAMTRDELRERLVRATRRYAKRQATWFRSEPDLHTVPPEDAERSVIATAREIPGWA
jgi:tRNA dimethylallyltransferase